jgi:hypothetical protein
VADFICRREGWARFAFADPLKAIAERIGWDGTKRLPDEYHSYHMFDWRTTWHPGALNGRALLQELGVAVRDLIDPDAWVMACAKRIAEEADDLPWLKHVVITDVRFPNEAAWVESVGGTVVRVERDVPELNHVSERPLQVAVTLDNNGTLEELEAKAVTLATMVEGGM